MQTATYTIGQSAKIELWRGALAETTVKGITDTSDESAAPWGGVLATSIDALHTLQAYAADGGFNIV